MNFQSEQEYNDYMAASAIAEGNAQSESDYAAYMQQQQEEANLTPTAILSLFQTNKDQRMNFISGIMQSIEDGKIEPLKIHLQLKCIEDIIFQMTSTDEKKNKDGFNVAKRYKKFLQDAAEKFGQKKFTYFNSTIEIKEVGTKYDWAPCADPDLIEMLAKKEELDEAIKKKQELLKLVPAKGMIITNEETGDTYTVYPPAKSSTTSIAVSLK